MPSTAYGGNMNTTGNALTISRIAGEKELIHLAAAVDALDNLQMMFYASVALSAQDRDLTEYI